MSLSRPAVLFDLDGTLVDSIELLLTSMRHAFTACALPVPPDAAWIAGIGTPLQTQFRDFTDDATTIAALVTAYRGYQREHHDRLTRTYAGIPTLLADLRKAGHPVGVVTSKIEELAHRALDYTGIAGHVDVVIGADGVSRHKPHPEPVHVALARLGRSADTARAWFVGDSPHDVNAGNAAGVRTVGVTWGPFSRETLAAAGASVIVDSVPELGRVLLP